MTDINFLDRLNNRNASKRQSQQESAKTFGQSPTKTESDWLHGVNITRFAEMFKHEPVRFEREITKRVAWQVASQAQRTEIMAAIHTTD